MMRDLASQTQVNAADPTKSTWLAANAGSGKTRVLTDRVARLLIEGVDPQNILCLTYTKAAASEMQNRLFKRLGAWAMQADEELRTELVDLGIAIGSDTEDLANARRLFATAIETIGGLKIQTIHSFCSSILRRFPLESGVSPQFTEMDDQTGRSLRREVLDHLANGPDAGILKAFFKHAGGGETDKILSQILDARDHFAAKAPGAAISDALGLSLNEDRETLIKSAFPKDADEIADRVLQGFASATKSYQNFAKQLRAVDVVRGAKADFEALKGLFLRADGTSKSDGFPQSNHTKAIELAQPFLPELHAWMDLVSDVHDKLLAMDLLDRSLVMLEFGQVFLREYDSRKLDLALLDFDDLIRKARALLSNPEVAQWVLFRLDGGIDHVLVDEAQDTSPTQWDVIRLLTAEFTAGIGARDNAHRSIFVVGDTQQSIYSFQGADPDAFDTMKHHFSAEFGQIGAQLSEEHLRHSFRSSKAILDVVDNTFLGPSADAIGKTDSHIAFKENMPGRVDLWEFYEASDAKKDDGQWFEPVDSVAEEHHNARLANSIAKSIKRMIAEETLPQEIGNSGQYNHRPIHPGDFIILVQRRSELFTQIIRACKSEGLPIAGADRLRVGAELAVKDIAALLQFLALPEDDLSLACALRSPLFGWSEQDIYTLSYSRPGYLWQSLRKSDHHQTLEILNDLRREADFLRPYNLIERILTRHDGRKKLLARLGTEAEDGIDALLSQALAYESTGVPSLTGFLIWMETDDLEIKRQMDSQGDQIRVMTVHGAKGLEAPIVILPETADRKTNSGSALLKLSDGVIWKANKDQMPRAAADLSGIVVTKSEEERLRLLYVAMTRAEKWLIVAGAGKASESAWYRQIEAGLNHAGATARQFGDVPILRHEFLDWAPGAFVQTERPAERDVDIPSFGMVITPNRSGALSPSDLGGEKTMRGESSGTDHATALAEGRLVHRLLEVLPAHPSSEWRRLAPLILQMSKDATYANDSLIEKAVSIISDPQHRTIFGASALAEVDIVAHLPTLNATINGSVDRLIIEEDRILAIDFKTNQVVPASPEQTPEGILRQMGAYYEALSQIYPDKKIETAILWTSSGQLMYLTSELVSKALGRVSVP